mgnify:CR=1 FL=1
MIGQTVGNYTVVSKLGEGGMGVVYIAEHPLIGKRVALKVLRAELAASADTATRFFNEAKAVNAIGNAHIVDIFDFGRTASGEYYFTMELLEGEPLAQRLTRGVPTLAMALDITLQVADALAASHAAGVVHRDLKPDNIFVVQRSGQREFIKVLDFGIAKLHTGGPGGGPSTLTRTGMIFGTPQYMSPEQCEGAMAADHRSDIYALGILLYQMLVGRVPFGGQGVGSIIIQHIQTAPPKPRELCPEVPEAIEAVVLRALAKRREERFQSMGELREALEEAGVAAGVLRRTSSMAAVAELPSVPSRAASVAPSEGAPSVPLAASTATIAGSVEEGDEEFDLTLARQRKRALVRWGAVAIVAVGVVVVALRLAGPPERTRAQAPETPTAAASAAPPVAAVAASRAAPSPRASAILELRSDPPGADVLRDGSVIATTPARVPLDLGWRGTLIFRAAGYQDATRTIEMTGDASVQATLVRRAEASPVRRKRAPKPPPSPAPRERERRILEDL